MIKYLIPLFTLLVAGCGRQSSKQKIATQPTETTESIEKPNTQESDQVILQDSTSGPSEMKSLNDIRFGNWTEKEWFDNDYFRTLRKYIDACYKGEIKDEVLEPYRFALKGKFAIFNAGPFIGGGMFIYFVF